MSDAQNKELADTKCLKLLVRTRLDMEKEFVSGRKKKSVLWARVIEKMKAARPNLKITKEQINRKFFNLQTTYKRIKTRNKESGKNSTTWEFYDDFDQIYGDSTEETSESENSPEPGPKIKKKDNQHDILRHLQEESKKEQKRHEEIIAIEERKMEIEKRRIEAMLQLKDALEKTARKQ